MAICVHTPTGTTGATLLGGKLLSDVAGVTTCKSFGSRPASPRRTKSVLLRQIVNSENRLYVLLSNHHYTPKLPL